MQDQVGFDRATEEGQLRHAAGFDSPCAVDRDSFRDIPGALHSIRTSPYGDGFRLGVRCSDTAATRVDSDIPKVGHILEIAEMYGHAIQEEAHAGSVDSRVPSHIGVCRWREANDDVEGWEEHGVEHVRVGYFAVGLDWRLRVSAELGTVHFSSQICLGQSHCPVAAYRS